MLMKNYLVLLVFLALTANGTENKYYETMGQHIKAVYGAQSTDELLAAVNALDRIGQAEKSKWEPFYYSAFGYLMMANREKEMAKKDSYLDQAAERVKLAAGISNDNSEVTTLEGFVHMLRVTVDPATRGRQYSGLSMQAFGRALKEDQNNPRALGLMAQMQFGTAKFLGSSTDEACGMAKKALQLFDTYTSENPLAPRWGRETTEGLVKSCNP